MSSTLKIDNFTSINIQERARLAADVEAGATSIVLDNNQDISANDFMLIGNDGSGTAEITSVQTVTDATIATTDPLRLRHDEYEDVLVLFGDKIKIYRADNVNGTQPADAAFATITALGIPIDSDQKSTVYTDPIGSAEYWYKYTYLNSVTLEETPLSNSLAARGGAVGIYATLDNIRSTAGFENNHNITDPYIDGFRRAAQDQINGTLSGVYSLPFVAPINGFITQITEALAAGHIKLDQHGRNSVDGQNLIDWAESQLAKIRSGDLVLTDITGTILPQPGDSGSGVEGGSMGFSGYPNNDEQGGGFKFQADMRY